MGNTIERRLGNSTGRKFVLVHSGGLDSTVLLAALINLEYDVHCIGFNYGSKHAEKELEASVDICLFYGINRVEVSLPLGGLLKSNLLKDGGEIPDGHYEAESMKQTVVPFRNGIMAAIAAGYAESIDCEAVAFGVHSGDHHIYPDCRPGFLRSMSDAMCAGTEKHITLFAPFYNFTKETIVSEGHKYGVPFELTWTCYKGKEIHCGVCGSCTERKEAFVKAGVTDPTEYEV